MSSLFMHPSRILQALPYIYLACIKVHGVSGLPRSDANVIQPSADVLIGLISGRPENTGIQDHDKFCKG